MKLRTHFGNLVIALVLCLLGTLSINLTSLIGINVAAQSLGLPEGFEAGGKTSYAAGTIALGSGQWFLNDALTGDLSSDPKIGTYSARIRNTGAVRMNFNRTSAGTITLHHAKYGTDNPSSWELWLSTNNGGAWSKVGSTVATTSTSLQQASFTVNVAVPVRFEVRKVSGGTARLNIDNIGITTYVPVPTPTPTPVTTPTPPPPSSTSVHLTMGNPSSVITNVTSSTNYLIVKPQYALSYHRDNGTPNWVSWHLDRSWLGSTPRQNDFRADTTALPAGWYEVQSTDYTGSGYDRGHLTPSGDRTLTTTDNSATFLMMNIIPQMPTNNQGPWASLEAYCRTLVSQGNELYIIAGGSGTFNYIANGRVAVPFETWKVIIVLPSGTNNAARVTAGTRTIAVIMPNTGSINPEWRTYRVSVDQVEARSGYNLLANVADTIENVIETQVDNQ